jgi:hypothetical protein
MDEATKPWSPLEFIERIAPPDADEAWIRQALMWADVWSCSLKKYTAKQLQNENKPDKDRQTI